MTNRTFASWVEPVASLLAERRREVIAFARSAPVELWGWPSEVPAWTCKDILSHLAGGNDRILQTVLRSVTARAPVNPSLLQVDTDAENARGVEERRDWPIDALIAALEKDGDEVQDLLSRLTEEDEQLGEPGVPMSLADFLHIVQSEQHDLLHLQQIRRARRGDQP